MTDTLFLRLNEKFALGADDLQWILYRANSRDPDMTNPDHWRGVSFVRPKPPSRPAPHLRCLEGAPVVPKSGPGAGPVSQLLLINKARDSQVQRKRKRRELPGASKSMFERAIQMSPLGCAAAQP
jgi:hypothetical protein